MRHLTLVMILTAIAVAAGTLEANAGRYVPKNVRQQILRRFDSNGDGKLSVMERGNARIGVGAIRQNSALQKNQNAVKNAR